jgi:protoporphyrinogen oxidase
MLDAAEAALASAGVKTRLDVEIEEICRDKSNGGAVSGVRVKGEAEEPFEKVLYCAPTYALDGMLPGAEGDYFEMIREKEYFGVVCVVLALEKNLTPSFWTYVNDKRVPFVGVINYSPFLDYEGHEGHHVVYIPAYCYTHEEPYTKSDETILSEYYAGLKVIWPEFDAALVREARVFRVPNASLVVTGEYSKRIPGLKSPIPGLYFANLAQIYPQDRGISISMKLAQYAVEAVEKDEDIEMKFVPY